MNIKLIDLINEIIEETGDLKNLSSYNYNKKDKYNYNFHDINNDLIEISFQLMEDYGKYHPALKNKEGYNVWYTVNKESFRYKNVDYKELMKILKTILNICQGFIEEIEPDFLFIKGTGKSIKDSSEDLGIKDKIYISIINQNTPENYNSNPINLGPYEGILIAKNKILK